MSLKLIVFLSCLLVVLAEDSHKDVVPIVHQEAEIEPDGKFHWSYEDGDGSKADQVGTLKEVDNSQEEVFKGSYEYTAPDGKLHKVEYEADEKGYRPHGEDIPTIPPLIQKSLDYIASHPPQKEDKH